MNRFLSGELTPARARLLKHAAYHLDMPVPDELGEVAERGKADFSNLGLTAPEEHAAQYLIDMQFRASLVSRNLEREDIMRIVCAALEAGGENHFATLSNDQRNVPPKRSNVELLRSTMPKDIEEVLPLRNTPLVIDIDSAQVYDSFYYRLFPKVILIGSKIYQFNLFAQDAIATSAQHLYPAVRYSLDNCPQPKLHLRKLMAGLYPVDLANAK